MTAVSFVKGSKDLIEGLAIPFGGPLAGKDLDGEFFTKDTDLCLDWFETRPMLYHHGLDGAVKASVVGRVKSFEIKDDGLWVQAQLDKNSRYRQVIGQLIDAQGVGFSSGAMQHLVESDTKTGEIKVWPWVEESLTPTPANPDALQVYAVKSTDLIEHLTAIEAPVPSELIARAMKALDEQGDNHGDGLPDGLSYADEGDRLLVTLKAFVGRSQDIASMRAKTGRLLSETHRQRLTAIDGQLGVMRTDIKGLLASTDPGAEAAALAALEAEWEFIVTGLPEVAPV